MLRSFNSGQKYDMNGYKQNFATKKLKKVKNALIDSARAVCNIRHILYFSDKNSHACENNLRYRPYGVGDGHPHEEYGRSQLLDIRHAKCPKAGRPRNHVPDRSHCRLSRWPAKKKIVNTDR